MNKLTETILNNGIDKVFFLAKVRPLRQILFVTYTSSRDPEIEMLCKIDTNRYKVEDGYKITLEPIHKGFALEHYYVTDLQSLINRGHVKLLIQQ